MRLNLTFLILAQGIIVSSALAAPPPMRYLALGDSYTIGTSAQPDEAWPSVVTARLQSKGAAITLVGNLGHNGWTSQNLIDGELPGLDTLKPDFVTLLIGVNDWVQGVDAPTFRKNVEYILGKLLKKLKASQILVITIPDFSVTPTGRQFSNGRDIAQGIKGFNRILLQEAQAHHLNTVDLFALSQGMGQDASLIAQDGLHPSSAEYAKWAGVIEPAVNQAYTVWKNHQT
jgi:lysophospholipase L1-like esterase